MPAAASVVLAVLLGASPEVVGLGHGAAPSGSGHGERREGAPAAPVEATPPPSTDEAPGGPADEPAPAALPASASAELVDPWASVPLQTAVPVRPIAPAPAPAPSRSSSGAPLLDPWAAGARLHQPRHLDPELRDPFNAVRSRREGPRLARADLRDPFARRDSFGRRGGAELTAPVPRAALEPAAPAPSMPLHPDLRDPFGRRKAGPTPPSDTVSPAPRPLAPPPAAAPPGPRPPVEPRASEHPPGPGALLPSSHPFAHLPRVRRPA